MCVVSLLTTPWCWVFDEVILLIPLIQVAAVFEQSPWTRRHSLAVAGYVVTGGAILAMNVTDARAFAYIWTMPVFFALYLLAAGGPTHVAASHRRGQPEEGRGVEGRAGPAPEPPPMFA